jgi:O-methyltransferase
VTFEDDLLRQTVGYLVEHGPTQVAIIGYTPAAVQVKSRLVAAGFDERLFGLFDPAHEAGDSMVMPWAALQAYCPDLVVITDDLEKEQLLLAVDRTLGRERLPDVVIAGTAHLGYADTLFAELDAPALVPSYATGYPNTRIHLFQCLRAAADNGLEGAVAEFGAFKGGTTAWLARVVSRLGLKSKVIAFDSWSGFPPRRSILDLYVHPRCEFSDLPAVRAYLEPLGVELVVGDIAETAGRLADERVLLAFIDTDNYSPARAALKVVIPNLVVGGAIVFDHYETTSEYVYTAGERIAAKELLGASGLLQLHGTGVFVRIS